VLGGVDRVLARRTVTVAGGLGVGFKLDACYLPPRHVQAYGLVRGTLEPSVQEAFRRVVAPGATVLDVGANLGFFSLLASRLAGPCGKVVAVEALPDNAEALRANCALNDASNVTVLEAAASDGDGRGAFLHVEEGSWSHLADRGWHRGTVEQIEVELTTVDGLIDRGFLAAPDVVKIDVEGSEAAVLDGMTDTLRHVRPILIIELHGTNQEVFERLEKADYFPRTSTGPSRSSRPGPYTVLARPRRAQA